ncbi:MAG: hypothetical protein BA869_06445 [Desulfuromonadales bacterium C00003107]|nr:MAG: hypothetical protein BA869_06445 [Desulfuromonadales bacterium C00003107]
MNNKTLFYKNSAFRIRYKLRNTKAETLELQGLLWTSLAIGSFWVDKQTGAVVYIPLWHQAMIPILKKRR